MEEESYGDIVEDDALLSEDESLKSQDEIEAEGILVSMVPAGTVREHWFNLVDDEGRERKAEVLVAMVNNNDYQNAMGQALSKYAARNGSGNVSTLRSRWLVPRIVGKTILKGIRGWRLGSKSSPVDSVSVRTVVDRKGRLSEEQRTVRFSLDSEGCVEDTLENRTRLLIAFPGLVDFVSACSRNRSVFPRVDEEEALGNS